MSDNSTEVLGLAEMGEILSHTMDYRTLGIFSVEKGRILREFRYNLM